jgi:hypothetical protein
MAGKWEAELFALGPERMRARVEAIITHNHRSARLKSGLEIRFILSKKLRSFFDRCVMKLTTESIDNAILRSLRARKSAAVFSAKHFLRYGNAAAVGQALSRLAKKGKIRRIRQGLYDMPREHPVIGKTAPDPMARRPIQRCSAGTGSHDCRGRERFLGVFDITGVVCSSRSAGKHCFQRWHFLVESLESHQPIFRRHRCLA